MTTFLSVVQVRRLHQRLIEEFGGAAGLGDGPGLEAAVARPAATFGGEDLYPDLAAKAAALMHSLALNHPFVDGNKRVAATAAEFFLIANDVGVDAGDSEWEQITLAAARGEVSAEALAIWFRQRAFTLQP